jgi:hypothetical protein
VDVTPFGLGLVALIRWDPGAALYGKTMDWPPVLIDEVT